MANMIWVALREINRKEDMFLGLDQTVLWFMKIAVHGMLKKVLTVILEPLGLLLSHAGKSDQRFLLLDYHLTMNQESAVDSCEAGMLGEHIFVSPLRVWWWPMGSERGCDLQCLLLGLLGWAPAEDGHVQLPGQPCFLGCQPGCHSETWFHQRLILLKPWNCPFVWKFPPAEGDRQVTSEPWELARDGSRWRL